MIGEKKIRNLIRGFAQSAERFAERPALVVDRERLSYGQLSCKAQSIALAILKTEEDPYPLAALLAYRSVTAYAGVLGILASGKGYVPLNPKFPIERTRTMLLLAGCSTLVVGTECLRELPALLARVDRRLLVVLPEVAEPMSLPANFPNHRFVFADEIPSANGLVYPTAVDSGAVAYLMFTSGSTGVPKGVPIYHRNVRPYVECICDRYEVTAEDRFSQQFDQTFDLSVHDMFVAWERGACLFSVPERSVMAPAKFIREQQLTMWFSVPSVIGLLSRMRLLSPNCFPSLRCSLFCGEPLLATQAQLWQQAAPHSIVENLYGPTETTIAISHYRWDADGSPRECVNGIVPIGWSFAGQSACVIGDDRQAVAAGNSGELCLAGSQVTTGYWNNPEKTCEQFVRLAGMGERLWYRTGDLVQQDERGCLHYIGRTDQQIKIRGYRAELQEIEAVLRKVCGTEEAVSVPLPSSNGSTEGVAAFVSGTAELDSDRILSSCRQLLPDYMVPWKIYSVKELPLNANGKVDRSQLAERLKGIPE